MKRMVEGATSLGFQNSSLPHCTGAECELQVMCMDNVANLHSVLQGFCLFVLFLLCTIFVLNPIYYVDAE